MIKNEKRRNFLHLGAIALLLGAMLVFCGFSNNERPEKEQKTFVLHMGGKVEKLTTDKETVGKALKKLKIKHERHRIYPGHKEPVTAGLDVYVLTGNQELKQEEIEIEPPVRFLEDREMDFGVSQVTNPGEKGLARVVQVAAGGKVMAELHREILKQPVEKVVVKGTKQTVMTDEGLKRYVKILACDTVAYSADPEDSTYLGYPARQGSVAVDPDFIPLGTKLWIPGYGIGIAADIGTAVVGNIVDLCMDTYEESCDWGRQDVDIYVLEEVPEPPPEDW